MIPNSSLTIDKNCILNFKIDSPNKCYLKKKLPFFSNKSINQKHKTLEIETYMDDNSKDDFQPTSSSTIKGLYDTFVVNIMNKEIKDSPSLVNKIIDCFSIFQNKYPEFLGLVNHLKKISTRITEREVATQNKNQILKLEIQKIKDDYEVYLNNFKSNYKSKLNQKFNDLKKNLYVEYNSVKETNCKLNDYIKDLEFQLAYLKEKEVKLTKLIYLIQKQGVDIEQIINDLSRLEREEEHSEYNNNNNNFNSTSFNNIQMDSNLELNSNSFSIVLPQKVIQPQKINYLNMHIPKLDINKCKLEYVKRKNIKTHTLPNKIDYANYNNNNIIFEEKVIQEIENTNKDGKYDVTETGENEFKSILNNLEFSK